MEEKNKKGPGDIKLLTWPECVLVNPEYMIGSLTPDPTGKQPCEGACNAFREIIDNAIDATYDNPEATVIMVDTENFNGYNFVADNSWGIPIKMSEVPGKTMAHLSISSLNSGSKFKMGNDNNSGASIGRHGVGSSCTCALSSEYILLSKITQDNFDKSIPEVKKLWESQGPRSKKDLFYIVVYKDYGKLAFEGAMKLSDIDKKLGTKLPTGMSTMVLFKLGSQYVPDTRVSIPYDNLNYFLLIMKEFYKRKVTVIANGKSMTAADLDMYKFKIMKTIVPEDTSKNKDVKVLIYFDVDPEMSPKNSYGSVNGLVVNTGLHINYVETCFDQAIRSEYKISHKYTMNGFKSCIILLAEVIGFDSQTKVRLKSIGKVKQSDFTDALVKEFIKVFRSNPEYWQEHVSKLNAIYNSMRSITADEKIAKMIEDEQGNSFYKSKNQIVEGYAPASASSSERWGCELFLVEGLSPWGSLKSARIDIKHTGVLALRGKVKNMSKYSNSNGIESLLDNKEYFSIFKLLGMGVGDSNVIKDCKTREEAFNIIKLYAKYSSVIIATDADEDGLSIQSGLLYTFSRFARFMIDFGMVKIAESPVYIQGDKFFYPSDPLVPGTRFPVGLNLNKEYKHIKGLGSLNKDEAAKAFFDKSTRRLITVTTDGIDYSMGLVENIDNRKKLLFDAGILSNPYNFTDI